VNYIAAFNELIMVVVIILILVSNFIVKADDKGVISAWNKQ
jgi:uncharacterized BrkB/YihY/UPF0761 family membrane protein